MAQAVHLASCKQCGLAQISKNLFSVWCVYNCLFSVMCVHVLGQDGLAFLHCCPPSSLETQSFTDPREPLSPHTGAVTPVLLISLADWTATLRDLPIFTVVQNHG